MPLWRFWDIMEMGQRKLNTLGFTHADMGPVQLNFVLLKDKPDGGADFNVGQV